MKTTQNNVKALTSPLGSEDIYGFNKNFSKAMGYQAMVHRAPSTFTSLDKKEHARKRRVLSQCFSDCAVRSFEPIILEQMQKFCDKICPNDNTPNIPHDAKDKGWSSPVNMSLWCKS